MTGSHQEKPSFTDRLKEVGKELHAEVENTAFIQSISLGEISDEAYKDYLASLHMIYFQLESDVAEKRSSPIFEPLYIPELFRSESIKKDLEAFGGIDSEVPEAAKIYRENLGELSDQNPHSLIAHYYLRFLGDLFGGQIMGGRLRGRFDGKLVFYDFTQLCESKNLSKPTEFARSLHQIINSLPLDEQQQEDILDEVVEGYQLHLQLFKELEDRHMNNG